MFIEMTSQALAGYLIVSGLLVAIGIIGFLSRRNLIVMFLCTELMFQGAALAFIAAGRYLFDYSGQVMVIFILTVAAAEAALARTEVNGKSLRIPPGQFFAEPSF